ncbi:hypothetical protein [Hymenobacter cavernae]|uniref:YcxB family protein n=1 Tax=Hymenobacter cavernae TaxID=2044852 RepID=A0ABQ1UKF4_9BACT|nr:hypothetical protein [Hymenobacter cavernae]GGF19484.1 hypothetical protein GCM10011383_33830 [Hymenobacter cavernae]
MIEARHVTMTADEYVAVNYQLWGRQPRTRRVTWLLYVSILLLTISFGLGIWQWAHHPATEVFWGFLPAWGLALVYAWWRSWQVKRQFRQGYTKNTALQQPIDYQFSDENIISRSAAGEFVIRWQKLRYAVHVGDWLLLYPQQLACYYVDLRRLVAPATPDSLEDLLDEKDVAVY